MSDSPAQAAISDAQFINEIVALKSLRSFLMRQAVLPALTSFGQLSILKYSDQGRDPSDEEWRLLDQCASQVYPLLTENLRAKYLATQAPRGIARTALLAALCAILTTALTISFPDSNMHVFAFAVWTTSMGVLGSLAFVGMNVLALQDDITFDYTNLRLTILRVVLGGLFGLVIAFPYGIYEYVHFLAALRDPKIKNDDAIKQASYLLLPFVLGFSTTVVIIILGRIMQGVQALFGTLDTTKPVRTKKP
ncbi:hypothetical protein Q8F57_009665 [Paraburkholderia terrae]|uniref:hypothetical protein n=1 Tax=Paraburkholderia terrae TaxID=311230 RepID=UPI00296AC45D|nr:hypothetical protein [Paraburkholderia terrae]MDW3662560.1 hypothetical protein [Paraburkholderia terrae]